MRFTGVVVAALVAVVGAQMPPVRPPPPPPPSGGPSQPGRNGPGIKAFDPLYGQQYGNNPRPGPSMEEAKEALEAVVRGTNNLFEGLAAYENIRSINDEKLVELDILNVQYVVDPNSQQDNLIQIALDQVRALTSEVDTAGASVEAALTMARRTANITSNQAEEAEELVDQNAQQDHTIGSISITAVQGNLLSSLQNATRGLTISLQNASEQAVALQHFVEERRCLYGTVHVSLDEHEDSVKRHISFRSEFDVEPVVTMSLTGFVSEIDDSDGRGYSSDSYGRDRQHGESYDSLGVTGTVDYVTTTGFDLLVSSGHGSRVENTEAVFRWVACQNLNVRQD